MGVKAVALSNTGFIPNTSGLGLNLNQQLPEFIQIQTSDTLTTVLVTGYLNHSRTYFQFPYNNDQMALVKTTDSGTVWLKVVVTNPGPSAVYSLVFPTESATGNPLSFTGTLIAGDLLSVNNASGIAQDSGIVAANVMQVGAVNTMLAGSRIILDKATGTVVANAVTINKEAGVITTTALTTAAGATFVITLTDSAITTSSVVLLSWQGGTNTTANFTMSVVPGAGSAVITITNNNSLTAMNGTVIIGFVVF